jgi:hypothetical protein
LRSFVVGGGSFTPRDLVLVVDQLKIIPITYQSTYKNGNPSNSYPPIPGHGA